MRLYELLNEDDPLGMGPLNVPPMPPQPNKKIKSTPLSKKLVSLTAQIKSQNPKNLTRQQLLKYYSENGITLSPDDLTKMVKQEPLKNLIANIKGESEGNLVIFKGQEGTSDSVSTDTTSSQQEKEVKSMAKNAMKKHRK